MILSLFRGAGNIPWYHGSGLSMRFDCLGANAREIVDRLLFYSWWIGSRTVVRWEFILTTGGFNSSLLIKNVRIPFFHSRNFTPLYSLTILTSSSGWSTRLEVYLGVIFFRAETLFAHATF